MIEICNGLGVTHLAASKAIMKNLGVDCGPVRPPLLPPTPAQQVTLISLLEEMGFFNFACKA
jgi:N-acetylneuraminate lyase